MEKWHLIKNQPVLKQTFKDPPILSYSKGRPLKYTRQSQTLKVNDNTIGPKGVVSGLSILFTGSPSNNVIFFWCTAEHSPSTITGSNCEEKARLPIQAWFLSTSRKWSPKKFFARRRPRRRAYAATSNAACHDKHEKISSWVSFSFLYEYGAPLGVRAAGAPLLHCDKILACGACFLHFPGVFKFQSGYITV